MRSAIGLGNLGGSVDEQLRRGSALVTKAIIRHFGRSLGVWVGCGYPKSGTVWLCQLLSSYLDLPYPRQYRLPVAFSSVVHAHWLPDDRLPRVVYIVRDGRDVMVSQYFYELRAARNPANPVAARRRQARFERLLGPRYDLVDPVENLPRFVEAMLDERSGWVTTPWHQHVAAWLDQPGAGVGVVRFEDLVEDGAKALAPSLGRLTGGPVDLSYLRIAEDRFSFKRQAGRPAGAEDRDAFLRKGVVGDWQNYFNDETASLFDQVAGPVMRRLGYQQAGCCDG